MIFSIDHIGWITNDIKLFEDFWCDVLSYQEIKCSNASEDMMGSLFGASAAVIKRYHHRSIGPDIEIHYFPKNDSGDTKHPFYRAGINHICLLVGGPGSKQEFLNQLPSDIQTHVYDNPGGWQNIFVRDYEGNWIELREEL